MKSNREKFRARPLSSLKNNVAMKLCVNPTEKQLDFNWKIGGDYFKAPLPG